MTVRDKVLQIADAVGALDEQVDALRRRRESLLVELDTLLLGLGQNPDGVAIESAILSILESEPDREFSCEMICGELEDWISSAVRETLPRLIADGQVLESQPDRYSTAEAAVVEPKFQG